MLNESTSLLHGDDDESDEKPLIKSDSSYLSDKQQNFHTHRLTLTFCTAFFCLGVLQSCLGPTLLDLQQRTASSASQVSLLFTSRSVGYMTGSLMAGWYMDRIPATWVLALVVTGAALSTAMFSVTVTLVTLLVAAAFQGICLGGIESMTSVMMIRLHRGPNVASYLCLLHGFFGFGSVSGPLLVLAFVSDTGSDVPNPYFQWSFISVALATIPAVLMITYEAIFPKLDMLSTKEWTNDKVLNASPTSVAENRSVRWVTIGFTMLFVGLYCGGEVSLGSYLYTFASESGIDFGSSAFAVILTSAFYAAFTIGRISAVLWVRIIPMTRLVIINMLVAANALVGLLYPTLVLAQEGNTSAATATLWIGAMLAGFAMGSTYPGGISIAEQFTDVDGPASSIFIVGACSGVMTVPLLVSTLMESLGPAPLIYTVAAAFVTAAIVQTTLQVILARLIKPKIDIID